MTKIDTSLWRCEHAHTKETHPDCYRQYLEETSNQTLSEYIKQKGTFETDHLFYMKDRYFLKLKCPTWNLTIVKRRSKLKDRLLFPVNINERFIEKDEKGVSRFQDRRLKERPIWLDKADMKLLIESLKLMFTEEEEEVETKQGELENTVSTEEEIKTN